MSNLSREQIEDLMASQLENLSAPSTMASVHNLLRIQKLDDQHLAILEVLKEDTQRTQELQESVEALSEKLSGLLPESHDRHHEQISNDLTDARIKEKQWRTIKTNAMAGIVILLTSFIGSGIWATVTNFVNTTTKVTGG
jgi:ElaB/YqjD/DUF883 family membrane-anchored ribosome-binding protein